jgi:hypothetical protein
MGVKSGMQTFLTFLLVLAMLTTGGVLFVGLIGFGRGSSTPERINALMRWRVVAQAGALILFALLLTVLKN